MYIVEPPNNETFGKPKLFDYIKVFYERNVISSV